MFIDETHCNSFWSKDVICSSWKRILVVCMVEKLRVFSCFVKNYGLFCLSPKPTTHVLKCTAPLWWLETRLDEMPSLIFYLRTEQVSPCLNYDYYGPSKMTILLQIILKIFLGGTVSISGSAPGSNELPNQCYSGLMQLQPLPKQMGYV